MPRLDRHPYRNLSVELALDMLSAVRRNAVRVLKTMPAAHTLMVQGFARALAAVLESESADAVRGAVQKRELADTLNNLRIRIQNALDNLQLVPPAGDGKEETESGGEGVALERVVEEFFTACGRGDSVVAIQSMGGLRGFRHHTMRAALNAIVKAELAHIGRSTQGVVNISRAARGLGIDRSNFSRLLRQHGVAR